MIGYFYRFPWQINIIIKSISNIQTISQDRNHPLNTTNPQDMISPYLKSHTNLKRVWGEINNYLQVIYVEQQINLMNDVINCKKINFLNECFIRSKFIVRKNKWNLRARWLTFKKNVRKTELIKYLNKFQCYNNTVTKCWWFTSPKHFTCLSIVYIIESLTTTMEDIIFLRVSKGFFKLLN